MSASPPPVPMQSASPPPRPVGGFSYGMPPPPSGQFAAPSGPAPSAASPRFGAPPGPPPPSGQYAPAPAPASPAGQYAGPLGQFAAPPGPPAPSGQYAAPPGQYGAPPGQFAAPPGQYPAAPSPYAAPPGQFAAPPAPSGQYAAPPGMGQYAAPPGMYAAPPGFVAPPQPVGYAVPTARPGQNLDIRMGNGAEVLVFNPPAAYAPTPLDAATNSKFVFQNNSLRGSERNFTAADGVSPEELKQFFMFNAGPPTYKLRVVGWHMEKRMEKDQNGGEREVESRKDDWTVMLDATKWIEAPGKLGGVDDAVNNFLKSSKSLRKVTLQKRVQFDMGGFLGEVQRIVRSRGWVEQTEANFVYENHSEKLTVHGAGGCHDVCDSTACKVLMCITGLCICWWPMKKCCFEDEYTMFQDLTLSINGNQFALASQNELPRTFAGYEAQINEQRREERAEKREYEREQREKEREENERRWQQERANERITFDVQVREADGRIVDERITW